MKDLDELLGSLCVAIKDKKLKSKQAAFNLFLSEIGEAKSSYTLEQICECINRNTGLSLSNDTYRTMIDRAKRKQSIQKRETALVTKPIEGKVAIDEKGKVKEKPFSISNEAYKDYMNACFNKERIVQQAIENDVSVETIRSWECANFVQVSNTLGNHIRNKR